MGQKKRSFVVLIDCDNLFKGIQGDITKLEDFSWLTGPILEKGILLMGLAFLPDYMSTNPPVYILSKNHRFFPIVCLGERDGKTPKQMDNVDARITELGTNLIEHYNFSDLVIVAGDADYNHLATMAKYHKKNVLIISARDALSGLLKERFETIEI